MRTSNTKKSFAIDLLSYGQKHSNNKTCLTSIYIDIWTMWVESEGIVFLPFLAPVNTR